MDFVCTFDTIDHDKLISKLELYKLYYRMPQNFCRISITNRTQSTLVNGYKSETSVVTYGTAQGSVLGPLIYITFVNDVLNMIAQEDNICMYADDMLILSQSIDIVSMQKSLQERLKY